MNVDRNVALLTGNVASRTQLFYLHKDFRYLGGATVIPNVSAPSSAWRHNGACPVNGVTPVGGTTAAKCTNLLNGGVPFVSPGGGRSMYVTAFGGVMDVTGMWYLADRLMHCSGLNSTNINVQPITGMNLVSAGVDVDPMEVEAWIEIYDVLGASATNVVVNYLNGNDVPLSTPSFAIGSAAAGLNQPTRLMRIPMSNAAAFTGINEITSVDLSNSTGTAGNFGVTLMRAIGCLTTRGVALSGTYRNLAHEEGVKMRIRDDACLALHCNSSGLTALNGYLQLLED